MIYLALASIIILFFLIALIINPLFKRTFGSKVCAICSACSLTWITLLVLRQLEVAEIDNSLIGVLMGGSVVGIMFELREYFKENKIKKFWIIRLLEITVGFYLAYAIAIWDSNMILMGLLGVVISFVVVIMLKKSKIPKSTKREAGSEKRTAKISDKEKQDAIKKLEESLEDCC